MCFNNLPIQPIGSFILAVRYETKGYSSLEDGILIPSDNKIKSQEVKVVSLGSLKNSVDVNLGDRILINKYSGIEVKIKGVTFVLLKKEDLLAKLLVGGNE